MADDVDRCDPPCIRPKMHPGFCNAQHDPSAVPYEHVNRDVLCCVRMDHGGHCVLADGHAGDHHGIPLAEGPRFEAGRVHPFPKPHVIVAVPGWVIVTALTCPVCRMHTSVSGRVTTGTPGVELACPPCGAVVKIVF